MKKLCLLLIVLGFSSLVQANKVLDSERCKNMMEYFNNSSSANRVTFEEFKSLPNYYLVENEKSDKKEEAYIRTAFKYMQNEFGSKDPEEHLSNCVAVLQGWDRDEAENDAKNNGGIVRAPTKSTDAPKIEGTGFDSSEVGSALYSKSVPEKKQKQLEYYSNHCDSILKDSGECIEGSPALGLPQGFIEYMAAEENSNQNGTLKYSVDDCLCIQSKWKNQGKNVEDFDLKAREEELRLDKLIFKAAGKKLLNEYAALTEDIQYYIETSDWVMKESPHSKVGLGKRCQDPAAFELAVKKLCTINGTTQGSEQRLSLLLGSFDNTLSSMKFSDGLQSLLKDIGTFTVDSKNVLSGKPNIYTRREYDAARQSISKDEPQLKVSNDIVTLMLSDEGGMKEILLKHIESGKSPIYGVMDILIGGNPKQVEAILSKLEKKYSNSGSSFKQLKKEIGTEKFKQKTADMFSTAINLHPGFKNLMNDADLFKKTASLINTKNRDSLDVLSIMNRQKKVFNEHMTSRCESIQDHIAQAVCTKPEDIRKKVNASEMYSLVRAENNFEGGENDAKDLAICRMSSNLVSGNSLFAKISMSNPNPYEMSDYYDRKINPNNQNNGYATMAIKASTDAKFAERISKTTKKYEYARLGGGDYKGSGLNSDSSHLSISKNINSRVSENAPISTEPSMAEASTERKQTPVRNAVLENSSREFTQSAMIGPNILTPNITNQSTASIIDDKRIDSAEKLSYERLSRELSSSEDKARIKSFMGNISEEDAQEILRLRDQAMKDRATISDLRIQQEREKTEALRAEYDKLKMRLDNLEQPAGKVEVAATGVTQFKTGSNTTADNGGTHFDTATLASPISTGGASGGRGAVEAMKSAFAAGAMASKELAAGGNNAAGVGAGVGREIASEARGSMNLVVSQTVGTDGKIQAAEDPNNALINYLTKNEPSMQQLQELKTSGLLYTEEDVTKEGKKIQTKKVIKYSELSVEAKRLVERKLATVQLQEAKRNYSRQALMLELLTVSNKKTI